MSNFAENLENSPQRAILKAVGFIDGDLEKPIVGILSAYNPMMPGHSDLKELENAVAAGISSKGGVPVVLPIFSICDGLADGHLGAKFCLPSRDLTADAVETVASAHALDGMVLLASCDKTVAGMVLGCIRVNTPSIVLGSGPAKAGCVRFERKGFSDVVRGVGSIRAGKISKAELLEMEDNACASCGTCEGMSDSINTSVEALGLSLAGNSTAPAGSVERRRLARRSGEAIMKAVAEQLAPKKILSLDSIKNAIALNMGLLPSSNTHLHLLAFAKALGINFDKFLRPEHINQIGAKTPLLADVRPAGNHFVEDFHAAGGTGAVISELLSAGLLAGSCLTVSGNTLSEVYKESEILDSAVIRTVSDPLQKQGGLVILTGNLAEQGAAVKRSCVSADMLVFSGPAKVFDCLEDAAIAVENGRIREGDCLVARFEGPKGGPGMREITPLLSAIYGANLENKVAVVTDGRVAGNSRGLNVCQVTPEAYGSNPLAVIRDDDVIEIDVKKYKLAVKLAGKELDNRRKKLHVDEKAFIGVLKRYKERVGDASTGAVVD